MQPTFPAHLMYHLLFLKGYFILGNWNLEQSQGLNTGTLIWNSVNPVGISSAASDATLVKWLYDVVWKVILGNVCSDDPIWEEECGAYSPIDTVGSSHQPVIADQRCTTEQLTTVGQGNDPRPGPFFGISPSNNPWTNILSHQFCPTHYWNKWRKSKIYFLFWWIFFWS